MSALWDVWWMLQREKERETVLDGRGVPSQSPFVCGSPICFPDARQLSLPGHALSYLAAPHLLGIVAWHGMVIWLPV